MSSTSVAGHHKITRPNAVAVGTIVWLSSELMFFAALFAIYFTTRAVQGPTIWTEAGEVLNIPFAALNTTMPVRSLCCRAFPEPPHRLNPADEQMGNA